MRDLTRVQQFVAEYPWAILPSALDAVLEIVDRWAAGVVLSSEKIEERIGAARRSPSPGATPGAIAVIPVWGVLSPRMGMVNNISGPGGTSTEAVGLALQQAVENQSVSAIVLDVDSPGGSVFGLQELSDRIHAARQRKPVVAVANSLAASAAYWIASQADELVVAPGGQVGSIGVIAYHDDLSKKAEQVGVRRTFITAGRFKAEGNEFEPLSDEARASMQSKVDAYYDTFIRAVSRGRRTSLTNVRENFGEGRLVLGSDAVRIGMADREGTLQETIARLAGKSSRAAGARAEDEPLPIAAEEPAPAESAAAAGDPERLAAERLRRRARVAIAAS